MKIVIVFFVNVLLLTGLNSHLPKKFDKKIDKETKKIWNTSIEKTLIQVPDSIKFSAHNLLFELKNSDSLVGIVSINRVRGCKIGGCDAIITDAISSKYEHFYYSVILDNDLRVLKVSVLEYESDYGYEITSKNWLKQFTGKSDNEFNYGEEIDVISGATVSASSLVFDIQMITSYLESLKKNKSIF